MRAWKGDRVWMVGLRLDGAVAVFAAGVRVFVAVKTVAISQTRKRRYNGANKSQRQWNDWGFIRRRVL